MGQDRSVSHFSCMMDFCWHRFGNMVRLHRQDDLATKPGALSVSNDIYTKLPPSMKTVFTEKQEFEGKTAWSTASTS